MKIKKELKKITFNLRKNYFEDIKKGIKLKEYRLFNDYWKKRLIDRDYDVIVIKLGYPKNDEYDKILYFKWNKYEIIDLIHDEFGKDPVKVFAIDLSESLENI